MPKLTKRFVDGLGSVQRDTLYGDADLRGFGLRVKPSGVMTCVCQYRNAAGRTRKIALGRVGVLTPEEARQRAKKALLGVADGQDSSADRHARREYLLISELVEVYLEEGPADKPRKKKSSWDIDASNLRNHAVPLLGRRQAKSLTGTDMQRFQANVQPCGCSIEYRIKALLQASLAQVAPLYALEKEGGFKKRDARGAAFHDQAGGWCSGSAGYDRPGLGGERHNADRLSDGQCFRHLEWQDTGDVGDVWIRLGPLQSLADTQH